MPSHIALPQLAAADPAFIPTIEAYTVAPVGGGNTVDVLLNGDQICPAQLAAIRVRVEGPAVASLQGAFVEN